MAKSIKGTQTEKESADIIRRRITGKNALHLFRKCG